MIFKWETIINKPNRVTERAKVIGGWIVCDWTGTDEWATQSMVFVSDPDYQWEVTYE